MNEIAYLRELANRYAELAADPVMEKRADLWLRHNDGDRNYNPVIIEIDSFLADILPPLKCADPFHRELEDILITEIVRAESVGDDRVVPAVVQLPMRIDFRHFDRIVEIEYASQYGFHKKPFLTDLAQDLPKLKRSVYRYDREYNEARLARANEIIPAQLGNNSLRWLITYTNHVVKLMGMENFFVAMMDAPEAVHALMEFLRADTEDYLLWLEAEGLLTSNTDNHYAGSGSYGFTRQLTDEPALSQMWGNMNSQESVGISPGMFGEFVYPYFEKTARLFGKIYWGCCEPADTFWEKYLVKIPHLAKVSISAWCDEAYMGEQLADSPVIYSRKPTPNLIGVPDVFDEQAFAEHIGTTARLARDCNLEIIMRDIYTLKGDNRRAKKAVDIARSVLANR